MIVGSGQAAGRCDVGGAASPVFGVGAGDHAGDLWHGRPPAREGEYEEDETDFTRSAISYGDYALAVASVSGWSGTHLTAAPTPGDGSPLAGN